MTSDNTILTIAIIAVVVSGIGLYLTYFNIFAFEKILLGPTDTGEARVTIASAADITVILGDPTGSPANPLTWGSGVVPSGTRAVLDTFATPPNNVINFNGAEVISRTMGIIVENTGTAALVVTLLATSDAANFLGGTAPVFQYRMENCFTDPPSSANQCVASGVETINRVCTGADCLDAAGACLLANRAAVPPLSTDPWNVFRNMPCGPSSATCVSPAAAETVCYGTGGSGGMNYLDDRDETMIDLKLDFASNVPVTTHTNTITITGTAV